MQFDLDSVRQLVQLFDSSGVSEFKLEIGDQRLHLSRASTVAALPPVPVRETVMTHVLPPATVEASPPPMSEGDVHLVRSPIVGTFYRAPSPESVPFVEVGARVEAGQVVCIIEAMKLMNEITSEVSGTVRSLLVQNGDPVEFGQPLFEVV